MDEKTKKLVEKLKALRSDFMDTEFALRERKDEVEEGSFWDGYYDGKAEGYSEAAQELARKIGEWVEEILN